MARPLHGGSSLLFKAIDYIVTSGPIPDISWLWEQDYKLRTVSQMSKYLNYMSTNCQIKQILSCFDKFTDKVT